MVGRHRAWVLGVIFLSACRMSREPAVPPAVPEELARRTIESGAVIGMAGRYGGHAWLGVPFAKPPVGEHLHRYSGQGKPSIGYCVQAA